MPVWIAVWTPDEEIGSIAKAASPTRTASSSIGVATA